MNSENFENLVTGQAPPGGGLVSSSIGKSKTDRIDEWYLRPIGKLRSHDAFVCLAVVFLLYEKYLRRTEQIAEGQDFTKGHKVFGVIGADLGVDRDTAFEIWNNWRNGLLHRAMPMLNKNISWALTGKIKKPVERNGEQISLNPWLIRDVVLNKVRNKKEIWNDDKAPLMDVYVSDLD
jgi:hypothetical protein